MTVRATCKLAESLLCLAPVFFSYNIPVHCCLQRSIEIETKNTALSCLLYIVELTAKLLWKSSPLFSLFRPLIPIGPFVSSTDCFITVWLQSWRVAITFSQLLYFCAHSWSWQMIAALKWWKVNLVFYKRDLFPFIMLIESWDHSTTLTKS